MLLFDTHFYREKKTVALDDYKLKIILNIEKIKETKSNKEKKME